MESVLHVMEKRFIMKNKIRKTKEQWVNSICETWDITNSEGKVINENNWIDHDLYLITRPKNYKRISPSKKWYLMTHDEYNEFK